MYGLSHYQWFPVDIGYPVHSSYWKIRHLWDGSLQPYSKVLEEAHILLYLEVDLFLLYDPMVVLDDIWILLFPDICDVKMTFKFIILPYSFDNKFLWIFAVPELINISKRDFSILCFPNRIQLFNFCKVNFFLFPEKSISLWRIVYQFLAFLFYQNFLFLLLIPGPLPLIIRFPDYFSTQGFIVFILSPKLLFIGDLLLYL